MSWGALWLMLFCFLVLHQYELCREYVAERGCLIPYDYCNLILKNAAFNCLFRGGGIVKRWTEGKKNVLRLQQHCIPIIIS